MRSPVLSRRAAAGQGDQPPHPPVHVQRALVPQQQRAQPEAPEGLARQARGQPHLLRPGGQDVPGHHLPEGRLREVCLCLDWLPRTCRLGDCPSAMVQAILRAPVVHSAGLLLCAPAAQAGPASAAATIHACMVPRTAAADMGLHRSCGAMSHKTADCTERPRARGRQVDQDAHRG